ncbi:hypothetical protein P3X46_020824 [Hevea brasiliensis]|uniref:Transmembrane and coiled-coil domain-containing protein 4-like n=1 Tax=Hevea brasiliensis TaxID=3981 RepID=A0ABQ9LER6_HEVBR|nr:hypothetical protein P3X46_020824 [Hevea brasiliensis]
METSILTPTHKYAAAALFALALHQSQIHQTRPSKPLQPLHEEPIGGVVSVGENISVSDDPQLWIHENSEPHQKTQSTHSKISNKEKIPSESGVGTSDKALEERKLLSYQRKVTVLYELLSACVVDNGESDDEKSIQLKKGYDARHRVALRLLATWLNIGWAEMEAMEIMISFSLMDLVRKECTEEDKNIIPETTLDKIKRGGVIAAAALTGGTLMAVTGALTAPAISGGLGALAPTLGGIVPVIGASGFAAAASATGSVAGSLAVAASFGAAGAGLTGSKMARRIGSIDEFEFKEMEENHSQGRLAVGIFISGLVFEDEDFIVPWKGHHDNLERYALQWESENLIALSTAIKDWLASKIAMQLMTEGAMLTVLSSLLTALALPAALLAATDLIDSKWAIAVDRADKAGKLLAEVLLKGLQGSRPVTLIGFSLGARVIFKCLQCLAETEGDHAGIVERVVLLGAPVSIKDEKWEDVRKIVAGRIINVYSTNDWTLGVAFRANLLSQGLAGIQPVDILGIENVDVTQTIEGHASYVSKTKEILGQLELENYYPDFSNAQAKTHEEKNSGT